MARSRSLLQKRDFDSGPKPGHRGTPTPTPQHMSKQRCKSQMSWKTLTLLCGEFTADNLCIKFYANRPSFMEDMTKTVRLTFSGTRCSYSHHLLSFWWLLIMFWSTFEFRYSCGLHVDRAVPWSCHLIARIRLWSQKLTALGISRRVARILYWDATEAARVHFFSKKLTTFFSRRPQNLSSQQRGSYLSPTEQFW